MQKSPLFGLAMLMALAPLLTGAPAHGQQVLTGQNAFTDYSQEHPGVIRHLTVSGLAGAVCDEGRGQRGGDGSAAGGGVAAGSGGFKVEQYATGLDQPRLIRTAPNGDLFVAISYQNKVMVFRGVGPDGKPKAGFDVCG